MLLLGVRRACIRSPISNNWYASNDIPSDGPQSMTLSALDLYLGKIPSKVDSGIWDTAEETNEKVNKADSIGKKTGTGKYRTCQC